LVERGKTKGVTKTDGRHAKYVSTRKKERRKLGSNNIPSHPQRRREVWKKRGLKDARQGHQLERKKMKKDQEKRTPEGKQQTPTRFELTEDQEQKRDLLIRKTDEKKRNVIGGVGKRGRKKTHSGTV